MILGTNRSIGSIRIQQRRARHFDDRAYAGSCSRHLRRCGQRRRRQWSSDALQRVPVLPEEQRAIPRRHDRGNFKSLESQLHIQITNKPDRLSIIYQLRCRSGPGHHRPRNVAPKCDTESETNIIRVLGDRPIAGGIKTFRGETKKRSDLQTEIFTNLPKLKLNVLELKKKDKQFFF